jgi:hypothetical protein
MAIVRKNNIFACSYKPLKQDFEIIAGMAGSHS